MAELDKVPSSDAFYAVEPLQREEILTEVKDDVSAWRLIHWEGETNYSFPSGHTIFAAAVAIFWGAILMAEGYGLLASLVVGWASVVAASRLWLGMHWAVDVFASIASPL
ncbi:phosphatase PAP2 family protein [Enterovibrio coralii]|uniref:phosphatase PAP2 family protein n=1 Tax=Enterovibrio coralii TaxID=294935 RepID=UPI000ABFACC7|nr:phosphatase PAP2 family protein [Enterovibrio coralii]